MQFDERHDKLIPSDFLIMQKFWQDWFEESGVETYKIYKNTSSSSEIIAAIEGFINQLDMNI